MKLVLSTQSCCSSVVLMDVMMLILAPILCDVTQMHHGQMLLFMLLLWDWLMTDLSYGFKNVLDNLSFFRVVPFSKLNKVIKRFYSAWKLKLQLYVTVCFMFVDKVFTQWFLCEVTDALFSLQPVAATTKMKIKAFQTFASIIAHSASRWRITLLF